MIHLSASIRLYIPYQNMSKNVLQFHVLDLVSSLTGHFMECRRVVIIPRCTVGLNLIMGKYQ